jgi:APA family basic amino acid/polyamine antiporter
VESLKGKVDVGLIAGRQIFGPVGGDLVGGLICLGLVSAVSSMAWIGPRVSVVMGEDFSALRWLSLRSKSGTPAVAMLFQLSVVTVMIATSTFQAVLLYVQFTLILCSFLTVLGVIVLRIRRPDLPRPYKTWGYPFTPLIFLAITIYMMGFVAADKPYETAAGFATLLAGLVLYGVSGKRTRRE